MNRTASFLQGPDTEEDSKQQLYAALVSGRHAKVRLVNYSKSGEPFYNSLECFPLRDSYGALTHFCGVVKAEPCPAGKFAPRKGIAPQLLQPPCFVSRLLQPEPEQQMVRAAGGKSKMSASSLASASSTQSGNSSDGGGSEGGGSEGGSSESGISRRETCDRSLAGGSSMQLRQRPKRSRAGGRKGTSLAEALSDQDNAVVLTQPHPPYMITHVNEPWSKMCGYTNEEVEGMPNSILQGPETDQNLLQDLMMSVRRGEPTSATLVNYKKGGERFVNQVKVQPVFNAEDEVEQFMALLHEVEPMAPGTPACN